MLKGKVIIITGAGPGMGRAMCRGAAAEGARVIISARSQDAIDAIAADITASGGEAIAVRCDVTRAEECQTLAEAALTRWDRIDGLVNSAYYNHDWIPLDVLPVSEVEKAFDVIVIGALNMAHAVVPHMKAQGGGSIVNVSTVATRKSMRGAGGYAMAKAALNQMTRQLALELGDSGIRVNTALMGSMTGATLHNLMAARVSKEESEKLLAERAAAIPLGRIPPDADCAKAVYFLLSDYASEITGAALDVNGGDWVAP